MLLADFDGNPKASKDVRRQLRADWGEWADGGSYRARFYTVRVVEAKGKRVPVNARPNLHRSSGLPRSRSAHRHQAASSMNAATKPTGLQVGSIRPLSRAERRAQAARVTADETPTRPKHQPSTNHQAAKLRQPPWSPHPARPGPSRLNRRGSKPVNGR